MRVMVHRNFGVFIDFDMRQHEIVAERSSNFAAWRRLDGGDVFYGKEWHGGLTVLGDVVGGESRGSAFGFYWLS